MHNKPENIGSERFIAFLEKFGYGTEDQLKHLGKDHTFNGNKTWTTNLVDS